MTPIECGRPMSQAGRDRTRWTHRTTASSVTSRIRGDPSHTPRDRSSTRAGRQAAARRRAPDRSPAIRCGAERSAARSPAERAKTPPLQTPDSRRHDHQTHRCHPLPHRSQDAVRCRSHARSCGDVPRHRRPLRLRTQGDAPRHRQHRSQEDAPRPRRLASSGRNAHPP